MTHELKCWPEYFQAILDGRKSFEVRKNDRGFQSGDILHLCEWSPQSQEYTGRELKPLVVYTLIGSDFGIREGYIVMGLAFDHAPDAGLCRNHDYQWVGDGNYDA